MLLCEGCAAPLSSCWSKRIHLHTPPLRGKAMVFVFNAQFIVILLFAQSSRKDSGERERERDEPVNQDLVCQPLSLFNDAYCGNTRQQMNRYFSASRALHYNRIYHSK